MKTPHNPRNVPTSGNMTYAALETIRPQQLRQIAKLRSLAESPTWDADIATILGDDYDGALSTLSVAAGAYLIHILQAGLVATAVPGDDLQQARR